MADVAQAVLFQLTGVGVVQTDLATGRFVCANAAFCEMVGHSQDELRGMTYLGLTHPDDRERDAASFAALQRGKRSAGSSLTRVLHKGGQVAWLELHITVIQDETGSGYLIAVAHDVSDRRRAEEQSRLWEERHRIALEAAELATWDWDVTTGKVIWNEQHYRLVGLEPTSTVEHAEDFLHFIYPEDQEGVTKALEQALIEEVYRGEFRIVRADGQDVRWVNSYGRVVERRGGQARRMTGVMVDVTERKEAEMALRRFNEALEQRVAERTEELRQSEERARRAFDASPMPFTVSRLGDGTVLAINDSALAAFGLTREQVVGRRMSELGVQSALLTNREGFARQLQERRSLRDVEVRLMLPSGRTLYTVSAYEVVESNGEDVLLSMFLDVTERKRTEEQMHQAISEVLSDTSWFSHQIMERLAYIRSGSADALEPIELSRREREVLERVARGFSNGVIAQQLGINKQTVRNYISTVYGKLNVHSRAEAIVWARERGMI